MVNVKYFRVWLTAGSLAILVTCLLISGVLAQTFPASYYYTNPLFFTGYGYFNTINGYLLGFGHSSPFLTPETAYVYNSIGIQTYPYFGSPYQTTFPYTTLPGTPIPYARFSYPTYAYGDPAYYLSWVLLQ
ncbi:MAG: hypothetical protein ACMUIS_10595 [bacterium]